MNSRKSSARIATATACIFLLGAAAASAEPWNFVGARFQAMGGAGVAFADDSTASYWNPANLAYKKGFDVQLPITLNGNIENKAAEKLSGLIDEGSGVQGLIDGLGSGTPLTASEARSVINWLETFNDFGQNGEAVHFGVAVGLMGRKDNIALSANSTTMGTVYPSVDLESLALAGVAGAITAFTNCGIPGVCVNTPSNDTLANDIFNAGSTSTLAEARQYVWLWETAGANTSDPNTASLMFKIAEQTAAADPSATLAAGNTGALVGGLSTQEFGISYAHKLPIPFFKPLDNKISLGITPKYIMGIAYTRWVRYNAGDDVGDIVGGLVSLDNLVISHNFGLDLAVSYRPYEWLSFGMIARNVNSPGFSTNTKAIGDLTLDAQVRMGAAVQPIQNLTLAFDWDVTENTMVTLPTFKSRIISFGSEYAIPFGKSIDLALRFGAYSNVAGTFNQDWAITGGLGLRLWQFVLDLSAGGSLQDELITTGTNKTTAIPTRMNVGLTLKWEKSV